MFGRKKTTENDGAAVTVGDTGVGEELTGKMVEWRRHLHAHPELSYEERETTDYVEAELKKLGLKSTRFEVGTGLWCDVPPASDAPSTDRVGLRADIDALPMDEESGESFASEVEGVCHSCGHDAHTAMLLGAAAMLVADPPPRPVRLIFQPAEETMPGGAKDCVEEGVVTDVDRIIALHCDPHRVVGEVGVTDGAITSSNAKIGITVRGAGGHTARPHETQDVVFALAQVVTGVTAAVDRRIDPRSGTVLTWASIKAGGTAPNVIPDSGQLWGTLRSADRDVWASVEPLVRESAQKVAELYGVEVEVDYVQGVPPVVNDKACAGLAAEAVRGVLGDEGAGEAPQSSGGEDFAWYCEEIPGVYLRLGVWSGQGEEKDLHHPEFVLDERALPIGARILDSFARLDRPAD